MTAPTDHALEAERNLEKADSWANRDGALSQELRGQMVDYHLRLAQIHATLATADRLDTFVDLLFDQGRAIFTRAG